MFWKVYFWFVVFLAAISVPFYMKTLRIWEIIDVLLCLTGIGRPLGIRLEKIDTICKILAVIFLLHG